MSLTFASVSLASTIKRRCWQRPKKDTHFECAGETKGEWLVVAASYVLLRCILMPEIPETPTLFVFLARLWILRVRVAGCDSQCCIQNVKIMYQYVANLEARTPQDIHTDFEHFYCEKSFELCEHVGTNTLTLAAEHQMNLRFLSRTLLICRWLYFKIMWYKGQEKWSLIDLICTMNCTISSFSLAEVLAIFFFPDNTHKFSIQRCDTKYSTANTLVQISATDNGMLWTV